MGIDYMREKEMPLWAGAFPWSGSEVNGRISKMKLQSLPSAKKIAKKCLLADNAETAWILNTRGDRLFVTRKTK